MRRIRVIPVLLLHRGGLVKSKRFKNYAYIGDPINAVRILNEKEIDELVVLDIDASRARYAPKMNQIREIAGEAFVPLAYGGGVESLNHVKDLFYAGVEKIVINRSSIERPSLVTEIASLAGSQSVVLSIDVKKNIFGRYKVYSNNGRKNTGLDPVVFAKEMQERGAGEIFLNSIDKDGTFSGYDLEIIRKISDRLTIPVTACGGASGIEDFQEAIVNGASAVAAGSMFVLQRPHNAVLISYPSQQELIEKLYCKL